jgi:hypothetical protein
MWRGKGSKGLQKGRRPRVRVRLKEYKSADYLNQETEKLCMSKFNLTLSDTSSGVTSAKRSTSTSTSRKHVASCASRSRGRAPLHVAVSVDSDQQLRGAGGDGCG